MTPMKIGIIGLGVISRFYVSAVEEVGTAEITALCDINPDVLSSFSGIGVPCYRDHLALLDQADVDAVVVNVPNNKHLEVCRDAISSGRAVCVEKPLTTRIEEGRELARLADEKGVVLFTAFHRRYNENVLGLLRRISRAAPIKSMTVRYLERIEDHVGLDRWYLDPSRCGGGCVADNGPNAFDLVRLFMGDVSLRDAVIARDEHGVDRKASITLGGESGGSACVELDWSFPAGELKDVEVKLADGTVDGADMLAGYPRFKSSLAHEYVGVLHDFEVSVLLDMDRARDGLAALDLVDATYRHERSKAGTSAGGARQ